VHVKPLRIASAVALVIAAGSLAAATPSAHAASDARLVGKFTLKGKVTRARHVRGEHKGQKVKRTWRFTPQCGRGVCTKVTLRRQRSARKVEKLTLSRTKVGTYAGRGKFYFALRCAGRVYKKGGLARTKVTLSITRTATVLGQPFATAVKATYSNPRRTNRTPCHGRSLGRDGARYSGKIVAVPGPPGADFGTTKPDPLGTTVDFDDESARGAGGAKIVQRSWDFGDQSSGAANRGTGATPEHTFSAHGTYRVTLTVTDANGLTSTTTKQVVA
jgi:hypothetical protein